jgi:GTP pyrophosphokinase
VEWARAAQESFAVKLMIYTDDRPGMLSNVTTVLYDENANIKTLEARPDPTRQDDSAVIDTTVEVKDKKQLDRILSAVRRISGVRDVERST